MSGTVLGWLLTDITLSFKYLLQPHDTDILIIDIY